MRGELEVPPELAAVGIQGDNPPWGFVTSGGKQDGLDADIATLFAKELGVPVEFVPLEVNNRIPALTTGRVDVLFATMAMLPERAKAVQFSKPYVANTIVLIGKKSDTIKTNEDMGKFTIGVAKGAAQDTQVTKNAPSSTTIPALGYCSIENTRSSTPSPLKSPAVLTE